MNITTPRLVKNFLLNCASLRLGSASERINLRTQKFLSANKCSPILFLQPQCSIFLLQRGIVFELLRQSSSIETCQPSDELSYPTNDPEGCADDRQSLRYLDVWSRWPLWRMKPSALNFAPGSPVINSKSVLKYLSIYISRIFTFGLCLSFKWPLSEGLAEDHLAICIVRFGTKLLVVPRSHADHCEDLFYNWNQKTLKNPRVPPTYLTCPILPGVHKGISTHAETLGGIKNAQVQLGLCSWCWEWYMWGTGKPRLKPRIAKPCYLCCFKLRFTMTQMHGEKLFPSPRTYGPQTHTLSLLFLQACGGLRSVESSLPKQTVTAKSSSCPVQSWIFWECSNCSMLSPRELHSPRAQSVSMST